MKSRLLLFILIASAILLAGCAAGANPAEGIPVPDENIAGFWLGLWHGVISPVTFIISLFSDNVNIYEAHNNGGWYNFGFMFGMSIIFGGPARASASKR
jgi:hypothetical protein